MTGLKDFQVYDEYRKYDLYFVNLNELGLDIKTILKHYKCFNDFCERFRITIDELVKYIKRCSIVDKSLFEFSVNGNSDKNFLFLKKAVYVEKNSVVNGKYEKKILNYNVYIVPNDYVSLPLNKIAKEVVFDKFPFMKDEIFCKTERRFDENIHKLPDDINTKITDIDVLVKHSNDLTIADLINIYNDRSYMDSLVKKSLFSVYHSGEIYLDLGRNSHSLHMNVNDFFNKDWKSIERRVVHSIILYDNNGNRIPFGWFDGEQKDAPYFNDEKVTKLKSYIIS